MQLKNGDIIKLAGDLTGYENDDLIPHTGDYCRVFNSTAKARYSYEPPLREKDGAALIEISFKGGKYHMWADSRVVLVTDESEKALAVIGGV